MAAPADGVEHVVSVAVLPSNAGTTMIVRADGQMQEALTSPAKAALNPGASDMIVFGNEAHPDSKARTRGLNGTIDAVRLSPMATAFTEAAFTFGYTPEVCDVEGVEEANWIDVSPTDCDELIAAKLSALRPTEKQATYMDHGMIAFMHVGPNTFTNTSWGHGDEDPMVVNPTALDTDQWAKTMADAGYRMMMVTIKHHDGFLLYDLRYTTQDMGSTPGEQNIVKMYTDSARKYGLRVGMYVSPADSFQEKPGGTFGNGSSHQLVTIPTLVDGDDRAGAG